MPADERREIEAAMDRLLNGTPLRSDGKLTVVSLAGGFVRVHGPRLLASLDRDHEPGGACVVRGK
jgi:hypothetical protein